MVPSVSQVANSVKQPPLGYLPASMFEKIQMDDVQELVDMQEENIHHRIIGSAVDSLTRFLLTGNVKKAFEMSFTGAILAQKYFLRHRIFNRPHYNTASHLASKIVRLGDESIEAACKLVSFDVWAMNNPREAMSWFLPSDIRPNVDTIRNIRIMTERGVRFIDTYGPLRQAGFSISSGDCTTAVDSGGGDFLTEDGLWDFKTSNQMEVMPAWSLQILMYYIMTQHSHNEMYQNVKRIGFFNPRQNEVYQIFVNNIPQEIIETVARDIIGYR